MASNVPQMSFKTGIVKLVNSGDNIVIRKQPKGGPPPEKNLLLSNITAPKLARQKLSNSEETKDENYAWEAREFLRKNLIGKEIAFTAEVLPNGGNREYGTIWSGVDPAKSENLVEALVSEGLAKVRDGARNAVLKQLQDQAEQQKKGIWSPDAESHKRDVKWTMEDPKQFLKTHESKPIKAIVEYVRDGSTVRVLLLPDFYYITLSLSGIRCPSVRADGNSEPFAEEARFFVESRLLQRDVEVVLESYSNNVIFGSIIHPQGNIAELLLRQGFAKCVDWSMATMKSGASELRAAEKFAKTAKLRMWRNYQSPAAQVAHKEFDATVVEIINADALNVKLSNGEVKKIFLASIKPPQREKLTTNDDEGKPNPRQKVLKPLYQIPWMFEAREFLRTKLIGKRVHVVVDYVQPPRDSYAEKLCCTINYGGLNVAEALVAKGFATVVNYKRDDDQRSSAYDKLLEAEMKASKAGIGVFAKKDIPVHRIQDTSNDPDKGKKFLPFLKRANKLEAIVEFVANGARMRLFIPKESVVVTFLLAGVDCPRAARPATANLPAASAEPFGDEAYNFTREKCLQRNVTVTIEDVDKGGNFYGWLWIENENLSVALVAAGFASMHFSAESSEYARQLKNAEESAKLRRLGIWANYVEVDKSMKEEESNINTKSKKSEKVFVNYITPDGHIYAVSVENGMKLENLMESLRKELNSKVPLRDVYVPKKGELCAAKFEQDDQWYRVKVEKVHGNNVSVFYLDYGNRAVVKASQCAPISSTLASEPAFSQEYSLVCLKLPSDEDDREISLEALREDVLYHTLTITVETQGAIPAVRLSNGDVDIGKSLVAEGLLMVENSRPRYLDGLWSEYKAAQESALNKRLNIWKHGDITEDDAKEFGIGR